jgi:hypothetical protein
MPCGHTSDFFVRRRGSVSAVGFPAAEAMARDAVDHCAARAGVDDLALASAQRDLGRGMRCGWFSAVGILIFHPRGTIAEAGMTAAEQVYEQAKLLPAPLARVALDFVLFSRDH